eukprot:655981_1
MENAVCRKVGSNEWIEESEGSVINTLYTFPLNLTSNAYSLADSPQENKCILSKMNKDGRSFLLLLRNISDLIASSAPASLTANVNCVLVHYSSI